MTSLILKKLDHYLTSGKNDLVLQTAYTIFEHRSSDVDASTLAKVYVIAAQALYQTFYSVPDFSDLTRETTRHIGEIPSNYSMPKKIVRRAKEAIPLLQTAIMLDSLAPQAHFILGKSYQYLGLHQEAFTAYQRAYLLDARETYKIACEMLFNAHKTISILDDTTIPNLPFETALTQTTSRSAFARLEACKTLKNAFILADNEEQLRIREVLSRLAGKRIFRCYVPLTGDEDKRIRIFAENALRIITSEALAPTP